jgi:hypothetical protein
MRAFIALAFFGCASAACANSCSNLYVMGTFDESGFGHAGKPASVCLFASTSPDLDPIWGGPQAGGARAEEPDCRGRGN